MSIEQLRKEKDVEVNWSFFPLHPETPMEGRSLADLFRGRESQVEAFQTQIKAIADEYGLPYSDRTMTYNSRLAQELGRWADTVEGGDALHMKLYQAYFVDNKNISDIDTLVQLAQEVGLDGDVARSVITKGTFSELVDADWQRAREMGLNGVPTFVRNDIFVVGHQSYNVLQRFLNHIRKLQLEENQGA